MRRDCPDAEPIVCNVCGEQGHMRRECPNKPAQVCRNCGQEGNYSKPHTVSSLSSTPCPINVYPLPIPQVIGLPTARTRARLTTVLFPTWMQRRLGR